MSEMIAMLAQMLHAGTSSDRGARQQAEVSLKGARTQPGYAQALFQLMQTQDPVIPQMAGIEFKNLVKGQWAAREDVDVVVVAQADKDFVKGHLVSLLLASDARVRAQLAEALTHIVTHETLPEQWPQLLPELVSQLQTTDINVITGVLSVSHSIFKSFRHKFKSDALFTQIKYVVDTYGPAFLHTFQFIADAAQKATAPEMAASQTAESLKAIFTALLLASKVFYSLNFQDLPEFFEDNMKEFMQGFHIMLTAHHPQLLPQAQETDTPTVQVEVQASVCENLSLYLEKYDEEFMPYLEALMSDVWTLLSKCSEAHQPMFDPIIINGCKFITTVLTGTAHTMLKDPNILKQICELIVIPHIRLREADEDMFEGDPDEFIRADIEGSDAETRRRAAHDLVKGLTKNYEGVVTEIFTGYVGAALQQQYPDEQSQIRAKDACMTLVTAIAAKGVTVGKGAMSVNSLVNIVDFFKMHVIPELQSQPDQRELLKAASLKFTAIFRGQLTGEMSQAIMGSAIMLLKSENEVVHTYAANLIDKLLAVKDPSTRMPIYTRETVKPISGQLLVELFAVLERGENDYVMRTILRVCKMVQEDMVAHVEMCITKLKAIVQEVCKNPKKPMFNHYMFEVIACLIKFIVKSQPASADSFEGILFEPFQTILQEDVADFIPYVIQLMRLLLEVRPKPCPPVYIGQLPLYLNVAMFDRAGNVPPLGALLQAYLRHMPEEVLGKEQLQPMLGVFQYLVSKKAHDHDGLWLLQSIFEFIPPAQLQPYMPTIFQILLQRLKTSSTSKYERNMCLAILSLCAKHGGSMLVDTLDGIQPGLAVQIINHVIVRRLAQLTGTEQKRVVCVGCVRLLCETPSMLANPAAFAVWPSVLSALVELLEAAGDGAGDEDEAEMAAIEATAVSGAPGSTYSRLHFAAVVHPDPYHAVPRSQEYLARSVAALAQQNPGVLPPAVGSNEKTARFVQGYLDAIGARLS